MGTVVPINYIEIVEKRDGRKVAQLTTGRFPVSMIVQMRVKDNTSIEWMLENFEVLTPAKIHAALAYYYDHIEEIEAELNTPEEIPEDAMTLEKLKEKIRERNLNKFLASLNLDSLSLDKIMPLKFYTDIHVSKKIAIQLRLRGVDIIHAEEVGMADASDEEHLSYATQNGYTVVSMDADFSTLHSQWLNEHKNHCGIFKLSRYLKGQENIGRIVGELFDYYQMVEVGAANLENEIYNQMIYIR